MPILTYCFRLNDNDIYSFEITFTVFQFGLFLIAVRSYVLDSGSTLLFLAINSFFDYYTSYLLLNF